MTPLLAGFLLGVAGSVHCLGMCGPLTWLSGRGRFAIVYHASRIGTYLCLGAVAGLSGGAVAASGWARGLAIVAGAALIAQGLGLLARLGRRWPATTAVALVSWVGAVARRTPRHPAARSAAFGIANGLMPCGLLYAALVAAAGLGDVVTAMTFVAGFGLGSLPVFAGLAASSRLSQSRAPRLLRHAMPVAVALAGLMLIARAWPVSADHAVAGHQILGVSEHID
jgi:sulfite exporter TauE/SafE